MNLIIVLGLFCSGLWLFELFLFCLIFIWMYCCCCCLLFLNRSFTRTPAATCALYTPYRFSSIQEKVQTTMLSIPPKQIIENKKDHIIWHWNNMSRLRTGTKMWQGQTYYFFGQNIIYCGHSYQILRFVLILFPIVSE